MYGDKDIYKIKIERETMSQYKLSILWEYYECQKNIYVCWRISDSCYNIQYMNE